MITDRIKNSSLQGKVMSAEEAAKHIKGKMTIVASGFTPSGYPKVVPMAVAKRVDETKEEMELTLICGASVGPELDGEWVRTGILKRRYPYQTGEAIQQAINRGQVAYSDMHLSHVAPQMDYGFFGAIDVAIVEAIGITEEGHIIPTTSVGVAPTGVKLAKKVIVEINTVQAKELEGVHDIYLPEAPPHREPIPVRAPGDRIGTPYIPCSPDKIVAIVESDKKDTVRPLGSIDENSRKISEHIIHFLKGEVKAGRVPQNLRPLQSGVGSVANAVMAGLVDSDFENLSCYTEVIQDCMLDLIDAGKIDVISGTSFTPSEEGLERLTKNMAHYAKYCILRPQEVSNNPEVIRRLGVIAMNTAIEVDIYGHVNSTNVMGSRMMNGLGGSGDFTRNAFISIYTTVSTAKNGDISSIVPMVSHVDHTEHDVMVVVTEQGLADIRCLSPVERARKIIDNCAHPDFRPMLHDYVDRGLKGKHIHEPHLLNEALSWHARFMETGSMKK